MCRDKDPGSSLQGQGHKLGQRSKTDTFCRVQAITLSCMDGFSKLFSTNVLFGIHGDVLQLTTMLKGQGHKLGSKVKNRNIYRVRAVT